MSELDEIDRIIAEVAKKHRILLKPTDPVFLFVTAARSLLERVTARPSVPTMVRHNPRP